MVLKFYSELFSSEDAQFNCDDLLVDVSPNPLTDDLLVELDVPFTLPELIRTLKDMHPSKSPGRRDFMLFFINNIGMLWVMMW